MRSPRLTTADDHALAHDLAERAGRLLLDLRAQGGDPTALKDAGDRSSHEFLLAELAKARPEDAVLSEEGIDNKARLTADRVWIVDPLDGTREFGEPGRTDWAVHVALWERSDTSDSGDLTAGAVALPAQGHVLSTAAPGEQHRWNIRAAITTQMFHRVEGGARSDGAGQHEEAGGTAGTREGDGRVRIGDGRV